MGADECKYNRGDICILEDVEGIKCKYCSNGICKATNDDLIEVGVCDECGRLYPLNEFDLCSDCYKKLLNSGIG